MNSGARNWSSAWLALRSVLWTIFASKRFRWLCAVEILWTGPDAVRFNQPDGVARPRVHRPGCRAACRVYLWICPERSGTPITSRGDPAPFAPQRVIWLEDKLPW